MQKNQLKPNRDKKKNIETGMIMGQNTNIFSQLSATFLQNKPSNTSQEEQFLKNTQIVQYHDQNINRLISLLRKKAEVTKIKAVVELHEEINKMTAASLEEFIPTFANLYLQIILNEPSKQIVEEFILMASDILTQHKKIVIKEINTLYSPLLLSMRLSKISNLLFTGSEEQVNDKALVLLMKKEVKKKFIVMMKIILECELKQKIQTPNYQRNCASLMRLVKQLTKMYEKSPKAQQLQQPFLNFLQEVKFSLQHQSVQQYFKVGGKVKGSILELYACLMSLCSRHHEWKFQWQRYAKIIGSNFLDKDLLVQQILWKSCNKVWFQSLIAFNKIFKEGKEQELNNLFTVYLPKPEEKLLSVLKLGGLSLYKQLTNFCKILPLTTISINDSHKSLVNKLTFQRKLLSTILLSQDENQARMQCYYNLVELLMTRIRQFKTEGLQEKKAKEVKSLCSKLQKECVQNLQERYYADPPVSKNYFSFYLPHYYGKIINQFHPTFDFKFNPQFTFALYAEILSNQINQDIVEKVYENCKGNLGLTLKYLQIFPTRPIQVDMSEKNPEIELAAKIYLLTSTPTQGKTWFQQTWDIRKKIIAYDARINQRDFDNQDQEDQFYKPSAKTFPSSLYERPELDSFRFDFFVEQLLNNEDLSILKYLTPLINDVLVPRNISFIDSLLSLYQEKCQLLKKGKWIIGKHEVVVIRIISQIVIEHLGKCKGQSAANKNLVQTFLQNYCQFVRLMSNYKMQKEVEDLLKRINELLPYEEYQTFIFNSCERSVVIACQNTLMGWQKQQQKIRKNRLNKCVQFVNKLLWYCLLRNSQNLFQKLAREFLTNGSNWEKAQICYEPWILAYAFISKLTQKATENIIIHLLNDYQTHHKIILLILSSDTLLPLQAHKESRWKFSNLKKVIQKQIFGFQQEKLSKILKIFVKNLLTSQNLQLVEGVKSLITYMIVENEQNQDYNTRVLSVLKESCVDYPLRMHLNTELTIYKSLIYIGIISVIPLRKISNIEELYVELSQRLNQSTIGLQYLQFTSICCIFWNKNIGLQETIVIFKEIFTKAMQSFQRKGQNTSLQINFAIYAYFSLINTIIPHIGKQFFQPYSQGIESLLWKNIEQGSDLYGLTQSVKMKFATRFIMSANEKSKTKLIEQIPKIGRAEHLFYKKILMQIEEDGEQQLPHCQYIINLFVELAQFLIRIASFLTQSRQPEEQIILELIQCPFPALKKAAFLLLKVMYELKIIPREPPKMYASLLTFELKPNDELTANIFSSVSTYLYTWQALLLRREATERSSSNEDEINLSLEQYIQNEGYSDLLIKNCFFILEDKLEYLKNQKDYEITVEELMTTDYEVQLNENHEIQHKLFKMAIQTLYLYIIHFPIFLRNFMDKHKKYKNICDRLLRNIISDGIFKEEVVKIEMMEHQWKADGNFDIFLTPKNKEIYAEYTHDVIRIGLRLVMRGNYPLSPIDIQFGKGLKIQEGSRWGLMLQSQLHNRNNTIINGILLWKQNIDKKLSGIQECAICFDIVNPNGQLPKKGCKTCKKKFHGNCIMKWFTKSNKSQCPLCKSQFL